MDNNSPDSSRRPYLAHHQLDVWGYVTRLLVPVREAGIRDTQLRDQALPAARSACLNVCEHRRRSTLRLTFNPRVDYSSSTSRLSICGRPR
jgi:hypothetical protein